MKHRRSILSIAMATLMLLAGVAVYASTSVSAAPASSSASPNLVGGPIAAGTTPALCKVVGTNTIYVFVQGSDGGLWYRKWDGVHSVWITPAWQPLGGQIMPGTSPAAVSRSGPYMDVYVTGTNGFIYQMAGQDPDHFFSWWSMGGVALGGTGPSASGWLNREDVWVVGTTGALYQRTWTPASGWINWGRLTSGGALTSSPAAVAKAVNRVDVFAARSDGAILWDSWNGAQWSGFLSANARLAAGTAPAICSYGGVRLDLFWKDWTTNEVYWKTWTGMGWGTASSIGSPGQPVGVPSAATSTYNGAVDILVMVRGANNGNIYKNEYYKLGAGALMWHGWYPLPGGFAGP